MAEDKKALLDLIPAEPIRSAPFEFGREGKTYTFRLLDCSESMWAETAAQKKTLDTLCEFFDRETALDLLKHHQPNHDLHIQWQELYALQAALCDEKGGPVVDGTPDQRAERMADVFSPIERHTLATLYAEFADEYDPVQVSDEDVLEIIATEGPTVDPSYWSQFGSSVLRSCALTLARHLADANQRIRQLETLVESPEDPEPSQTPKSTDG